MGTRYEPVDKLDTSGDQNRYPKSVNEGLADPTHKEFWKSETIINNNLYTTFSAHVGILKDIDFADLPNTPICEIIGNLDWAVFFSKTRIYQLFRIANIHYL